MYYLFDVASTKKNYGTTTNSLFGSINNNNNKVVMNIDDDENDNETETSLLFLHPDNNRRGQQRQQSQEVLLDIDEAVQRCGLGPAQYNTMIATGLLFVSDAMEIVLLSFLSHVAEQRWGAETAATENLTASDEATADDDGSDPLLRTLVFPAAIAGAVVWGVLSDGWFGRRPILIATSGFVALFGVATSLVTTYPMLVLTRCGVSFGIGGMTVGFDLCAELLPPNKRGKFLTIIQVFWPIGALIAHLALKYQDSGDVDSFGDGNDGHLESDFDDYKSSINISEESWRWISCLFAFPSIIALLVTVFFVPDSPRWYLAKGRHDDALHILRRAAELNNKDPTMMFPDNVILFSHEYSHEYYDNHHNCNDDQEDPLHSGNNNDGDRCCRWWFSLSSFSCGSSSIWQIFNLCSAGWISITAALWTTYFGKAFLEHGSVSMAVNVFSNDDREQEYQAIFTAASECLGLFVVLRVVDWWGRSATQCICYAISGVLCLALALFEDYNPSINPNLLLALVFLAHLFVHSGTITTWIATTEVLATTVRTTGHGTSHAMTRIGGAFSTYVLARVYSTPTVGLILFVTALWTASAASKLPETKVKDMGAAHYPDPPRRRRSRRRGRGQQQQQQEERRRRPSRQRPSENP
jgi:Sugar (and other) transporter